MTLKRVFDVALSGAGLIFFAPIIALIAAAIWLEDHGPVFFPQKRIGKDGRLFNVLKFRSMSVNPAAVEVQALKNDPRITRVGRLLRKTALDELPQIWNIFVGDMSFVGPRAQPEREKVQVNGRDVDLVMAQVPGFALRQKVRPGLTGIAQIYASRNVPHRWKFQYDLVYVKKILAAAGLAGVVAIFWLDLRLILLSGWNTLTARWEV